MNNSLDFLNSISAVYSSSLKGKFETIEDSSYLEMVKADPLKVVTIKKVGSKNDNLSQLLKLIDKINSSIKESGAVFSVQKNILSSSQIKKFKNTADNIQLTFSLPKENYIEARILCGASIEEIKKEVAGDEYNKKRLDNFIEERNLIELFPPKENGKCEYGGFTIETRKDNDGLYNAIIDTRGRELAELVKNEKQEGELGDSFEIKFRLPSDKQSAQTIKDTISKAIGKEIEVSLDGLNKLSEYVDKHINDNNAIFNQFASEKDFKEQDSLRLEYSDEPAIIRDNTSSPFDSERIVAEMSDPFVSEGPIKMDKEAKEAMEDDWRFKLTKRENPEDVSRPFLEVSLFNQQEKMEEEKKQALKELQDEVKELQHIQDTTKSTIDMVNVFCDVRGSFDINTEKAILDTYTDMPKIFGDVKKSIEKCEKWENDKDFAPLSENLKKLQSQFKGLDEETKSIISFYGNIAKIKEALRPEDKPKDQEEPVVKVPAKVHVGYAQMMEKKEKQEAYSPNIPHFRAQLDMKVIEKMMDKMTITDKGTDKELLHFAIVKNNKATEGKSPYLVIAKRDGLPATVGNRQVPYADTGAIMEFSVNLKEMKEKALKCGVDLSDPNKANIPLVIGKYTYMNKSTGVMLNPNSSLVKNKNLSVYSYDLTKGERSEVNLFLRVLKARLNQDTDFKSIKFVNKNVGEALTHPSEKKGRKFDGTLSSSTSHEIYIYLNKKAIMELPEADSFGNIKIAVCEDLTDGKTLEKKGLQFKNGNLVNKDFELVSDFTAIADPITYKNGQPYENIVKIVTVNKDELLQFPLLSNEKHKGVIAVKIDQNTNKFGLNTYQYSRAEQFGDIQDYLRKKTGDNSIVCDRSNIKTYEKQLTLESQCKVCDKEKLKADIEEWQKIAGRLNRDEYENAQSQYEAFNIIASGAHAQNQNLDDNKGEDLNKGKDIGKEQDNNKGKDKGKGMDFSGDDDTPKPQGPKL